MMKSWSGIPAHIGLAFEDAGLGVVQGGPLSVKEPAYYRWLRSGYWRLGLGWFLADMEPRILKQRATTLQTILRNSPAQAVVSIQPDPIAAIGPTVATALVHDCTFALLIDYYLCFSGLSERSVRMGHQAYRQALQHASLSIFASEWAAQSAVRDYGADPAKVHVVEFGANIRNPPSSEEVAGMVESRLSTGEYRFLFLGVEWVRKGGDDAVALVKALRSMGISAFLDIVGCPMEGNPDAREFCTEHGFLDKSTSQGSETLKQLLEGASFLLVPSVAECFGCVYCEANAYGVPSIGRDTGGVSQAIRPGINGFLLSEDGRNMAELAERIKRHVQDPAEYRRIAASSRKEFEERLNWGTFAEKTLRLLESVRA
jgi:glycosyltransferase involved in cell wall biosynthesis